MHLNGLLDTQHAYVNNLLIECLISFFEPNLKCACPLEGLGKLGSNSSFAAPESRALECKFRTFLFGAF